MAVAATVAWLVAREIHAPQSFMAPYAAVFVMSETVYRSLAEAARLVATIGLTVNVFVLPPLHLRDGRRAVEDVTAALDDLIRTIGGGLRNGWDDNAARQWRRRARALETAGDGTAPNAGPDFGPAFAELLDTLAAAVRDEGDEEGDDVAKALERSHRWRQALTARGVVAENGERLDWSTQATLLLAAERAYSALLVE